MSKLLNIVGLLIFLLVLPDIVLAGTLEKDLTFESNAFGGKERLYTVYLPDGYHERESIRYPVIYFLHMASANHNTHGLQVKKIVDALTAVQTIYPMIFVFPNGNVPRGEPGANYGGTLWAESDLYGPFRTLIAKDLVEHIDNTYRTIPDRSKRSLLGFSDGGIGAYVIGLLHHDVFIAFGAHSSVAGWTDLGSDHIRGILKSEYPSGPPYDFKPSAGGFSARIFQIAGAYSPNLTNPYFVDFPYDDQGQIIPEIFDLWNSFNADVLAKALPIEDLPHMYFDCGTSDDLNLFGNNRAHQKLDEAGIPHSYYTFAGGHQLLDDSLERSFNFLNDAMGPPSSVEVKNALPSISDIELYENYPNPFNPSTVIPIEVHKDTPATLRIYSTGGRTVKVLHDGVLTASHHEISWHGRDSQGQPVPSGVYFYELRIGDEVESGNMALVRQGKSSGRF